MVDLLWPIFRPTSHYTRKNMHLIVSNLTDICICYFVTIQWTHLREPGSTALMCMHFNSNLVRELTLSLISSTSNSFCLDHISPQLSSHLPCLSGNSSDVMVRDALTKCYFLPYVETWPWNSFRAENKIQASGPVGCSMLKQDRPFCLWLPSSMTAIQAGHKLTHVPLRAYGRGVCAEGECSSIVLLKLFLVIHHKISRIHVAGAEIRLCR